MNTETLASAQTLATMIGYQEGSVVSRVLLKKPNGNVTLFAFSKGEGLSEHTTPHEALLQAVEGSAEIEIGGQSFPISAGQIITLPSNVPHAIKTTSDFKMLLVMVKNPA